MGGASEILNPTLHTEIFKIKVISTLRGCYPNKNWWFQRLVYLLGRVVSWKQGLLGHNWKISWAERVCDSRWQECYYCSGRTEVQQQRGSSFLHFSSPTTPNTLFVLLALLLLYRMTVKLSLAFKARKTINLSSYFGPNWSLIKGFNLCSTFKFFVTVRLGSN